MSRHFVFKVKIVDGDNYFPHRLYRFMADPLIEMHGSFSRFLKRILGQDVYHAFSPRIVLHGGFVQRIKMIRFVPADDTTVAKTSDQAVTIEYGKKDGPIRVRRCKYGIQPNGFKPLLQFLYPYRKSFRL